MAAVRYYSRGGNTKALAEAIAEGAGVPALSVDSPDAIITEETDVLFIGGAIYYYGLDKKMKAYLHGLSKDQIKRAVVFSTSMMSKHGIDLLKDALKAKGIPVEEKYFYAKKMPTAAQLEEAKAFAKSFV